MNHHAKCMHAWSQIMQTLLVASCLQQNSAKYSTLVILRLTINFWLHYLHHLTCCPYLSYFQPSAVSYVATYLHVLLHIYVYSS